MKKAIEGEREMVSVRVVVITASWIRLRKSDPRGGEGQGSPPPPTNLTALRGGFAATGAPLVGQIVYPTFPLIHTCICMYGQKYTCQQICSSFNLFFCLQTETILVQTFSQFQKTISWISGAFILLHGQNNTFNNGILSCRKSSGVFFDIFWHFID